MSIVSNRLKTVIGTVNFWHPCTRVDEPSDVWVEDVIDMSVEGLVINARDDVVVTTSLVGMEINMLLVVVVSDVAMAAVVTAVVVTLEWGF